jgi:hypothetical protein
MFDISDTMDLELDRPVERVLKKDGLSWSVWIM